MALSVVSITPNEGFTSGRTRVIIEGTDFDLPVIPATGPIGTPDPSVKVGFGPLQATNIWVYPKPGGAPGETIIECTTPRYVGDPDDIPSLVDVTVENLVNPDTVVVADGFKYAYKDAKPNTSQTPLLLVSRALILELKRQIPVKDVVNRTHSTYDDSVGDGLNVVKISDIPAILISGPSIARNSIHRAFTEEEEVAPGDFSVQKKGICVDLSYTVTVVDQLTARLLNLTQMITNFVDENGVLAVEKVNNDPSSGYVYFDLDWSDLPEVSSSASKDDLTSSVGTMIVRGVFLDRVGGLEYEATYGVDEIVDSNATPF